MRSVIDNFHEFLIERINLYNNFLIYGYGELGKELYKYCSSKTKNITVIDKNVKDDMVIIQTIDDIVHIDKDILIINTVLDQIESLKINVNLKSKFPNNEILDCKMFEIKDAYENIFLSMRKKGYLFDIGWIESNKQKKSCDKYGNPLPWVTYPYIDFIESRLNKNMNIFEFGSGSSTIWYADRVSNVFSIEHDVYWFKLLNNLDKKNINVQCIPLEYDGDYCRFPNNLNRLFDLIIVDGRDRVNCLIQSINSLNSKGVIVLDDSERIQYKKGIDYLLNQDFKKIDFWGISPGIFFKKCTSVFYRKNNCLDI